MGIFDIFTNDSAKEAAQKNAQLYQQYGGQANAALTGYGQQAGDIFSNYGTQAGNLYANQGRAGTGILDTGLAAGRADLNNAVGAYAPLSSLATKYGGASNLYLDALGVNGPEGQARARAAFQTGPGYQFQQDEAAKAAANKAASLGIAGSGNTLQAISDRAQNIANTEYGGYLDRLAGFVNPELSATSGAAQGTAQGFTNLANLGSTDTARRLALLGDTTQGQAGVLGNTSAAQAQLLKDIAQGRIGIAGNVTGGQASANNAEAQAAQQGSANFWNALASLGSSAIKGFYGQPRAA